MDFTSGIFLDQLPDGGMLAGKIGDEDVVLARRGDEVLRLAAPDALSRRPGRRSHCRRHGALPAPPCLLQLADGRSDLRTGAGSDRLLARGTNRRSGVRPEKIAERDRHCASAKPTLSSRGSTRLRGDRRRRPRGFRCRRYASARRLRRSDHSVFRGRLSALRSAESFQGLPGGRRAGRLDPAQAAGVLRRAEDRSRAEYARDRDRPRPEAVQLDRGETRSYGALLLATGADPVHLEIAGAATAPVHYLRSFADSRAIVAKAATAKTAIVIGASFIGLEVAASLRARGIEVHVVAPDRQPLERVMGPQVGAFIRTLHETEGVRFHLGQTVQQLDGRKATLSDGSSLEADVVVVGVGVSPSVALAENAGLAMDRGVSVDQYLQTSAPGVYAAGDIARWPDPFTGDHIRVEHFVVAERQGQVAAQNILGRKLRSMRCRSSGASTTTSRSGMWVTPKTGMRSKSTAHSGLEATAP